MRPVPQKRGVAFSAYPIFSRNFIPIRLGMLCQDRKGFKLSSSLREVVQSILSPNGEMISSEKI